MVWGAVAVVVLATVLIIWTAGGPLAGAAFGTGGSVAVLAIALAATLAAVVVVGVVRGRLRWVRWVLAVVVAVLGGLVGVMAITYLAGSDGTSAGVGTTLIVGAVGMVVLAARIPTVEGGRDSGGDRLR